MDARSWWSEMKAIAARHGRRGRSASDATEDLAQDLALAALEAGATAERPGAWLERVGRNAAIDRWRGERRRHELGGTLEPSSLPPDPESALLATERRGAVRRALAALPRPQRRAALLRFHCDLPFEAVAARLGTEPATARTRVHRALDRLRGQVRGLRALFVAWPGVQAAALVLGLAAAAPSPGPAEVAPASAAGARVTPRPSAEPQRIVAKAELAAAAAPAPKPQPRPRAVERYDFEADEIEGTIARPDGDPISVDTKSKQRSLIELRWTLQPEILKSLEEL